MIAARLAGGNLFFGFFWWGFFWWGILGALGAARSGSEHSDFFLRGFVGEFFFWGVVGGVLDCKCWKKLKND